MWREIWHDIGPRVDEVLTTGHATYDQDLLLILQRSGYPEETFHTFSYSPLPDDSGGVGGLLCVVIEDTDRFIAERRLRVLREAGAQVVAGAPLRRRSTHSGNAWRPIGVTFRSRSSIYWEAAASTWSWSAAPGLTSIIARRRR